MEFSLESISDRIHFGRTKQYFQEVLSSYQNGNYRSSIVMLWSVAVCDIVYKLQHLVDLYDDTAARQILDELAVQQDADPKSSAWEVNLVDAVFQRTNLIDSAEYENLRYLQKQRHLSAHPVLNQDRELHTPNKETARSLLRNTLEGLLVKPPFYTQKILDELLSDVAENSEALNTQKKVRQYVESRYLSRLTANVELQIYRSLWKLVFKLENDDCEKHRPINLQVVEVIGQRNLANLSTLISGEQDYFSNVAGSGNPLAYLVFYLSKNASLYELLSQDARLKVQHCIDTDVVGKTLGWFVKTSLEQHMRDLIEWIESDERPVFEVKQWEALLDISDSEEWQEMFCKVVSAYYAASRNFDQADGRFRSALQPYLHLFSIETIKFLLPRLESNSQTCHRGLASTDHPLVLIKIKELDENFDLSEYPNFLRTVPAADERED